MKSPHFWRKRTFLLALMFTAMGLIGAESSDRVTVVQVPLANPLGPALPPQRYDVVATSDEDGSPNGYHLSFEVHVCADQQCRMVNVTMYWDALGNYQRLECPLHAPLTRKQHDPFTPDDYRKLDRILSDRQSILGTLPFEGLVEQPQPEQVEDVDGWSGATPLTVADSVVEGAAFTTWTLWRWANGDIVPHLRASTQQRATPKFVRQLLRSEDHREAGFALRHLLEPCPSHEQFVDDAFEVLENTQHAEHVSLALDFVCRALSDERRLHERLIESICRMATHTSRPVIDYFAAQPELHAATLEGLSGALEQLPYLPVHRILQLLAKREGSPKIEADVARLLDHENFFIARRAYEHLTNQTPGAETRHKLDAFREQYRDRL